MRPSETGRREIYRAHPKLLDVSSVGDFLRRPLDSILERRHAPVDDAGKFRGGIEDRGSTIHTEIERY